MSERSPLNARVGRTHRGPWWQQQSAGPRSTGLRSVDASGLWTVLERRSLARVRAALALVANAASQPHA